jgi:hypothetical protein
MREKYRGFIIPNNLNRRTIVRRLASVNNCASTISADDMRLTCQSQPSCDGCILNSSALIDYAVESKLITKCEALKITLDKS